jgi:hypothetical protein
MLTVAASCEPSASSTIRQSAIQNLAKLHGMNLSSTTSLRYDQALTSRDGINQNGNVRMGPGAYKQDYHWLAAVLFHEIVHSDQFQCYRRFGISFAKPKYDAERILVALDECEGFYWPWRNSQALGLSPQQAAALQREVQLWLIEIDDSESVASAKTGGFQKARAALIKRLEEEKKRKP